VCMADGLLSGPTYITGQFGTAMPSGAVHPSSSGERSETRGPSGATSGSGFSGLRFASPENDGRGFWARRGALAAKGLGAVFLACGCVFASFEAARLGRRLRMRRSAGRALSRIGVWRTELRSRSPCPHLPHQCLVRAESQPRILSLIAWHRCPETFGSLPAAVHLKAEEMLERQVPDGLIASGDDSDAERVLSAELVRSARRARSSRRRFPNKAP
jgi:hypothetical protein